VSAHSVEGRRERVPFSRAELGWPIALAVVSQLDVWLPGRYNLGHLVGPAPVVALLYAVTSLSLVWRRRAPLTVLAFVVTADAAEFLALGAPEGLGSVVPAAAAFYAVGRYAPTAALQLAAPLLLLGVAVHELTDPIFAFTGLELVLWVAVAACWPLGHAFRRRALESQDLADRARHLAADRDDATRAAVTAERSRIARELHDVVGHGMSVAVLQLVAADGVLESDGAAARTRVRLAEGSIRQALGEMRRLLGLLDREPADLVARPGLGQLDQLVGDTRAAGADVRLCVSGPVIDLPPGLDLAAYRIVQESLTNVIKHARPPTAAVQISYGPDRVVIQVDDDGRGSPAPTSDGRGLTGMRERARLYGGELTAGMREGGGYSVHASLPVDA
jgi:signal transduction histidine kinase